MTARERSFSELELTILEMTQELEVTREELLGQGRAQHVARARQMVWFVLSRAFGWHPKKIALHFGRDRSTVIHGINTIESIVKRSGAK